MNRKYLKKLVEADLLQVDSSLKSLKYSDWKEEDVECISKYLNERRREAETHLDLLNNMREFPSNSVPALTDADG